MYALCSFHAHKGWLMCLSSPCVCSPAAPAHLCSMAPSRLRTPAILRLTSTTAGTRCPSVSPPAAPAAGRLVSQRCRLRELPIALASQAPSKPALLGAACAARHQHPSGPHQNACHPVHAHPTPAALVACVSPLVEQWWMRAATARTWRALPLHTTQRTRRSMASRQVRALRLLSAVPTPLVHVEQLAVRLAKHPSCCQGIRRRKAFHLLAAAPAPHSDVRSPHPAPPLQARRLCRARLGTQGWAAWRRWWG